VIITKTDQKNFIQEVYAKNHNSEKQCTKCIYYVKEYKDDYTLRFFGYGEVKIRPACSFAGNYGFVSHNPARLCRYYEQKGAVNEMGSK